MDSVIYKILRASEWCAAKDDPAYAGSPDDMRDGFIHFSTHAQCPETVKRYFTDESEIYILAFDPLIYSAKALKWEASRGGDLFPHLFQPLDISKAEKSWHIKRSENGMFNLGVLKEAHDGN
ncbi:DUF952 domain-containing protein [Kordiimonas pumila]|uniref:DUF952 domain-containing protein n=1 Tax=Kordiimonas pumila TaxID=2161677 RepID=A0ABV7D9W9_9PROT|nr:DUF952 domain-containing protein [Kordiimonas pumila]